MQAITVFWDYICPFCFIGTRRVQRLVDEFSLEQVWKGWEIHPEVPFEGMAVSCFSSEMIWNLEARVRRLADEIELKIRMPEKLSNSRLALLGGEFAREAGRFHEYHEAVFTAYFQEGKDIGDIGVLVEIANDIGLEERTFREAVVTKRFAGMLEASLKEVRSLGLRGVPSFVFGDGSIVVGAQPYVILREAAEKSLRAANMTPPTTSSHPLRRRSGTLSTP